MFKDSCSLFESHPHWTFIGSTSALKNIDDYATVEPVETPVELSAHPTSLSFNDASVILKDFAV